MTRLESPKCSVERWLNCRKIMQMLYLRVSVGDVFIAASSSLQFRSRFATLLGFPLGIKSRLKGMPAMALDRALLERQLGLAKTRLDKMSSSVNTGDAKGKDQEKLLRRDPIWRQARAEVRKITNRLNRCADKEALQAEVLARKAAKDAADE